MDRGWEVLAVQLLLACLLVAAVAGDSALDRRRGLASHIRQVVVRSGDVVTTDGETFASARITFPRDTHTDGDLYAEWLSMGPVGVGIPQPPETTYGLRFVPDEPHHRLRAGLCLNTRYPRMSIEDIIVGREDSRRLVARYWVAFWLLPVVSALTASTEYHGPRFESPEVRWLEPKRFRLTSETDTLLFEQEADSVFLVTLRPRLR